MEKTQSFKESFLEVLLIVKAGLTTFWFWVPPLFAAYLYLQLYLMCITPSPFIIPVLMIVPIIISIYLALQEEKRIKAQYGLDRVKRFSASDPLGAGPQELTGFRWDVEKTVEDYERLLKEESESTNKEKMKV